MASHVTETVVGGVVLAAAVGFFIYAGQTAEVGLGGGSYELSASFRKADGVAAGGDVRISGVRVGSVREIALDPQSYQARVVMAIRDEVVVPDDSAATIASDGLLGGAYVSIQPGGSEFGLEPGDEFSYTQGSVDLLDLVGRAISGMAGE
jgi:phospholipid/cholesterol/gamma-HCH transport system substrate-binding protein